MSKENSANTSSIVSKVWTFYQTLYYNVVDYWVYRGLVPSSPALQSALFPSALRLSVLSPSPRGRGIKGEGATPSTTPNT